MAKKKYKTQNQSQPTKPKKDNINSLGFIKEALTLIGGLAGSLLAVYGLVKTFKDDAEGFSWLIFVGVVVWLIILWRLFQVRKTTAYSLLIISALVGIVGWVGWQSQVKATEKKIIVLVAQFDGPEETYGLHGKIMEDLRQATKGYNDTDIIDGNEVVTAGQGSEYARELGKKVKADLVIWAWYRPTENPNITIHFENLSPVDFEVIQESETYQPQTKLTSLESFEIQRQLGSETSTLVSFMTGLFRLKNGDYQIALERFEQILREKDMSTYIKEEALYTYIGDSHQFLGKLEQSIQDYDIAISLNSNYAKVYINRGAAYYNLRNYEQAIQDEDKAIQLNPKYASAYYNRGLANDGLGQFELAVQDFDKAIQLEPNFSIAYMNRGNAYSNMKQYERAIQDYDTAIRLEPSSSLAYNNRGVAYSNLQQNERAIQDQNRAIELNPYNSAAYANRGGNYFTLGQYDRAIKDFDKAIELDPNMAIAYYNRGLLLVKIGKAIEAEVDFKKYEELTGQKP